MTDNITSEEYRAEISMLNHEIYELQKKLDSKEAEQRQSLLIDKNDPFDNPTEYPDYSGSYNDINPQIETPGYRIPTEPGVGEKRRLRHFYNIGGACILFHFLFSSVLTHILIMLVMGILQIKNPGISYNTLYNYAYGSAIFISISTVVYLISNVLFTYIGLRWSKLGSSSLINTRNFSARKALIYCLCAMFIQFVAAICSTACDNILSKYGYSVNIDDSGFAQTGAAMIVLIVYQCIIAPITEEIFYRGTLLKVFSRANQRFAITASAVFFGLAHGNIPQFILAFLTGMFLAHIDIIHNSILPSIIVHIFINTTSMIINRIYTAGSYSQVRIANIIYLLIAAVGLLLFIYFTIKNKLPRTTPQQSRRGFSVAKTSVTVIAAFTALAGNTIINILS